MPTIGSPSTRSGASRRTRPGLDQAGQRRDRRLEQLGLDRDEAAPALLDVERRPAAGQDDPGAGDAGQLAARLRPRERRAVRVGRVDGREHDGRRNRVGLAHVAQPLDRRRDRELRPAQPLHEVAALRQTGLLHHPQLAVDGREPARDALAEHRRARHDAVAVEQRLGERPGPLTRCRSRLEQALDERPAAARGGERRGRPGPPPGAPRPQLVDRPQGRAAPKRLPGVVRHGPGPDEAPELGQRLALALADGGDEVGEEHRSPSAQGVEDRM